MQAHRRPYIEDTSLKRGPSPLPECTLTRTSEPRGIDHAPELLVRQLLAQLPRDPLQVPAHREGPDSAVLYITSGIRLLYSLA